MGEFILESIELERIPPVIKAIKGEYSRDPTIDIAGSGAYVAADERLELKVNFRAIGDTSKVTNEMLYNIFHEKIMSMLEDEKYLKTSGKNFKAKIMNVNTPDILSNKDLEQYIISKVHEKLKEPCSHCKTGKLELTQGTLPGDDLYIICDNCCSTFNL